MTKRLYVREITYKAYVLLDKDESPSDDFDSEIVRDAMEPDEEDLIPVEPGTNPLGWPSKALVYHEDTSDLMFSETDPYTQRTNGG